MNLLHLRNATLPTTTIAMDQGHHLIREMWMLRNLMLTVEIMPSMTAMNMMNVPHTESLQIIGNLKTMNPIITIGINRMAVEGTTEVHRYVTDPCSRGKMYQKAITVDCLRIVKTSFNAIATATESFGSQGVVAGTVQTIRGAGSGIDLSVRTEDLGHQDDIEIR